MGCGGRGWNGGTGRSRMDVSMVEYLGVCGVWAGILVERTRHRLRQGILAFSTCLLYLDLVYYKVLHPRHQL